MKIFKSSMTNPRKLLAISLALFSGVLFAAESLPPCQTIPDSVTTDDPDTLIEILELRLKPLTRCELQGEADSWLGLLKAKVYEISSVEIAVNYKKTEIEQTEEAQDALEEAQIAASEGETEDSLAATQKAGEALLSAQQAREKVDADTTLQTASEVTLEKVRAEISGAAKATDEESEAKSPVPLIADTGAQENVLEQAAQEQSDIKSQLLGGLTKLREERTALIYRLNAVLDALDAKGGFTLEHRKYAQEVSGIKVDVTDAEATWTTIIGWLLSSEGGLRWAKNLSLFLGTLLFFWVIAKFIEMLARRAIKASKNMPVLLGKFIVSSIRRVILFIGFIVALAMLEVQIGPIIALIGAAGFVVAFALQSSLANFASGILILLYRPFDVDDYVEISGIGGSVQSLNLLSVTVQTPDNKKIVISNNAVWGKEIVNYSSIENRRIDMMFGIGYEDDIEKAQRTLEEIVASHDLILEHPEPKIRLHELADSSVNFICRPWVKPKDYWTVYWDITKMVKERFDQEKLTIPYPQRDVHLHQT